MKFENYNKWLEWKISELDPIDAIEYFMSVKDDVYGLDRHIFDLQEKLPFEDEDILSISISASLKALDHWLEQFKNITAFYFTPPQVIIDDPWLSMIHKQSDGFSKMAPPHLSVIMYRQEADFTKDRLRRLSKILPSSWEDFNRSTGLTITSNLAISRYESEGIWNDELDYGYWFVHAVEGLGAEYASNP